MKRKSYLTIVGICLLTIFSFYYTNKIIEFSKSKDLIMIEIMNNKDNYNKISIDALINNNKYYDTIGRKFYFLPAVVQVFFF